MQTINRPIFDIFKSNKEKKSTEEEGEDIVEESHKGETDTDEKIEVEIDKKDNNYYKTKK